MKRILLLLCLCFIVGSSVRSQQNGGGIGPGPSWQRYTVKDEEFSVTLPRRPELTTTQAARKSDGKVRVQKQLRTVFDTNVFTIGAFENPEPRQSLEQFVAEVIQAGENIYDRASRRAVTIDGFDGIEYSAADSVSAAIVQFVATEKHLYRFLAVGPVSDRRAMTDFFSSIKLGKEPDGIQVSESISETVYRGREVDVKARIVKMPQPGYTKAARENGIQGTVVLKCVFAANGEVTNIRVVQGLPDGLTEQAVEMAKKIKFTPAMKDGKPVSMWFQLEFNFSPY